MRREQFIPQDWKEIPIANRPKIRYWLPAAAVDQEDLREEIRQLYERGFGGVEVVSLHRYAALYESEDGWGGEHWNQTIQTILDWTPSLPEEFEKRRGYSILPYLPFIGARGKILLSPPDIPGYCLEDPVIGEMVNHDYLETLTQCYCEYHLGGLSELSERYGKNLRYQVAYNKPFEIERCGLYLNFPENEALGRPSFDYLKTMAASVHLGRRKRYSFECAAEFGHGYGQDYEDLLWWIKRSVMAGINFEVLHGASYSGAYHGELSVDGSMPGVEWPGE